MRRPLDERPLDSFMLRPMHETDLTVVKNLENQCYYTRPWPAWLFREALRSGMSCWIMEADCEAMGFGIVQMKQHWAHLMSICIAAKYRGMGLGKKMTLHLLAEAHNQHAAFSWLEVRSDNQVAIRLYKALGFRVYKMRKNCYPSRRGRLSAIVMAKKM
ncbi:ribosomal protein S18-alanine N-acetyltransferase [Kaarinaea lacus]